MGPDVSTAGCCDARFASCEHGPDDEWVDDGAIRHRCRSTALSFASLTSCWAALMVKEQLYWWSRCSRCTERSVAQATPCTRTCANACTQWLRQKVAPCALQRSCQPRVAAFAPTLLCCVVCRLQLLPVSGPLPSSDVPTWPSWVALC